jgi:tetratricopeptide (TPR) repeat protein
LIHEFVSDLVENRKYEDVIACIEQAILSGQIQPWMHQVLALAMQAAGRPKAQIERVLLSSQDVVSNDARSMMHLAAYLARFDRYDSAIELYRQAAALDPSRPEPYVLALELAARNRNFAAIAWSAPEVLSYSWSKGRENLNRLAEQSAAEAVAAFVKNGDLTRAFELQAAMQQARQLDLAIRVEWNGTGDIDIEVVEPAGTKCSIVQPMTAGGGVFVHDGFGPRQDQCYEEYLCPQGMPGDYRVIIRHVSGEIVGKRARVNIVRNRGTKYEESLTETVFLGPRDTTVRLSLNSGRRRVANAEQQTVNLNPQSKPADHHSIFAQLGNTGGLGIFNRPAGVGYTPVVTSIPEGIRMGAMATVSGDRRYVRITAIPIFSTITDVFTFTFAR